MTTFDNAIIGRVISIKRAIEKRSHESIFKTVKNKISKEVDSNDFCYCKVERLLYNYMGSDKGKSNIAIAILGKNIFQSNKSQKVKI